MKLDNFFDIETDFNFDKEIPLIVLDHKHNFLIKKLTELGYINLVKVKNEQTTTMGKT